MVAVAVRLCPSETAPRVSQRPAAQYDVAERRVWVDLVQREAATKTVLFSSTFDLVTDDPALHAIEAVVTGPAVDHAAGGGTSCVLCFGHGDGATRMRGPSARARVGLTLCVRTAEPRRESQVGHGYDIRP